jgi:hypothetical protein
MNQEDETKIAQFQNLSPEIIESARQLMDEDSRAEFDDLLAIARARLSKADSIEYWFREAKQGKKIKLTHLQRLELDFIEKAWSLGLNPIVLGPFGSGKTSLAVMIIADEIGRNQNIRTQIVCSAEGEATKRGALIARILLSKDYKKVFPAIEKDPHKPWNAHNVTVKRTISDSDLIELEREIEGEPGAVDATCTCYGIESKALGSRSDRTIFDDIANEQNAINSPTEGDKISSLIDGTWLSRRDSPIGIKNTDYDITKDFFKPVFVATPWSENDCVFRRIKRQGYATILIGVNEDFTGYNVEIWGLPDNLCNELEEKYKLVVDQQLLNEDKLGLFKNKEYKIGDTIEAYHVYTDYPAKKIFTIPLSRPAEWYINLFKEEQRYFDLGYRCRVFSDQERAFPFFSRCLNDNYKVEMIPIPGIDANGRTVNKGYRGRVINAPKGVGLYSSVDLSGANRAGTVITVGWLLANYQRMPIDIRVGAWSGDEISDQITEVFKEYPEMNTMFVENAAQQDMWVKEVLKHKEKYFWWMKIRTFTTNVKSKGDKLLGVLAMDTAFTNNGFIIANSIGQEGHPTVGSGQFAGGCPCGFCKLIRDANAQLRMSKVSSDTLMSLWMFHSSLPQVIDLPTAAAPEGYLQANTGQEYAVSMEESFNIGEKWLDQLINNDYPLPRLKKHYRSDGSEIKELDVDWELQWSDEYEGDEDSEEQPDTEDDKVDLNVPQFQRVVKQKPKWIRSDGRPFIGIT